MAKSFAAFLAALALGTAAWAAPVKTPHVEAELVSRATDFQPGRPVELALRLKIIDHWHTYWLNPGDSGLPTKLHWTLPEGFKAGAIAWPHPKRLPLGPLMNYGYEGEVLHLVNIDTPAGAKPGAPAVLRAKAEWLVCSDVCIPESADLSISLPASATPPKPDPRWENAFTLAHQALPGMGDWTARASLASGKLVVDFARADGGMPAGELLFYPARGDLIAHAAKQDVARTADGFRLTVPLADPPPAGVTNVEGVLVAGNWLPAHPGRAITVSAPLAAGATAATTAPAGATPGTPPGGTGLGLLMALVFAFGGGLILNLMPCVFPVLGIKVMGFARQAASDTGLVKKQGLAFFTGVILSFWILAGLIFALRAGGESIGWGFQLQSPVFVSLLAMLFMLMALNLSGVFEMGLSLQSAAGNVGGQDRGGLKDAFLSGVLATVVATPCTAPLMGAALGYTLGQPPLVGLLVFTALAAGMGLPVLLLSLVPAWLRHLPRPGPWMETFRQFMAFPLYATVAWLAWVLGTQQGTDGLGRLLFGLVLLALAAWAYGHWQAVKPRRAMFAGAAVAAVALFVAWPGAAPPATTATQQADAWKPFSRETVASLRRAGTPVFIDFTASWCITCQVNKRVALGQADVTRRFEELGVARIKADWTLQDPEITRALAEFGRNGVPLYVYYPAGGEARVLPEILTAGIVLDALKPDNPGKVAAQ